MSEERTGKPSIPERLRDFVSNTKRIIRVARRPTLQEVNLIARVSGIGILLVGAVAYLLQILGSFTDTFFKAIVISMLQTTINIIQVGFSPYFIVMTIGIFLIAIGSRRKRC